LDRAPLVFTILFCVYFSLMDVIREAAIGKDAIRIHIFGAKIIGADAIRPYLIDDTGDAMNVVGHNNEFIGVQLDFSADLGGTVPFLLNNFAQTRQFHLIVANNAEQAFPPPGAQGNEIRPRLAVIIFWQAHGTAVVFLGIEFHNK
jgi:hypothetical protein